VRLLGYCREDKEVLLVEYMAKGSLENHLFRSEPHSKFVAISFLSNFFYPTLISSVRCMPFIG